MNKLMDIALSIYMFPLKKLLLHSESDRCRNAMLHFLRKLKLKDTYTQIKFYPKKASDLEQFHGAGEDYNECAIILQGPLVKDDNFTVETIKLYSAYYQGAKIIVSTWVNVDSEIEQELSRLNVKIIKNKYPDKNGIGNINYQLITSLNGVKYAEELKAEYIWKTRTDQRFYHPFALGYLLSKTKKNPERIICLGGIRNSFVNRYFQLSDFMVFGTCENVGNYYSCPLDEENTKENKHTRKNQSENTGYYNRYLSVVKQAEIDGRESVDGEFDGCSSYYRNPEVVLNYNYYCRMSADKKPDLYKEQYEEYLKQYVTIVDAEAIGFF
ncbi:MAG: WavE lipopolysaccharide synthesis family protein, partial [Oscillospiraceae bacterium]|nr:WavE lipopolysaccharide synthesis family protein [Oscillospiraceae bacterium]